MATTKGTREEWDTLQAAWRAAYRAYQDHALRVEEKYQHNRYAPASLRHRTEVLARAESRAGDRIMAWLGQHSPRYWRSGIACSWIFDRLTYEDAFTTGPLAALPIPSYGLNRVDSAFLARA